MGSLEAAIRRRHMVRNFTDAPVETERLIELLDLARRAPSAGNTGAVAFLVLDDRESVSAYWDVTLGERRAGFRWPGLLDAPALVIVTVEPRAYIERYAEPDKAENAAARRATAAGRPRLGEGLEAWPVPYWWVDAGAVAQNLLLLTVDRGLGACLFGLFEHEDAVRDRFGVPDDVRLVATVAIGRPAPAPSGRSAGRGRPPLDAVIHRRRWDPAPG